MIAGREVDENRPTTRFNPLHHCVTHKYLPIIRMGDNDHINTT